MILTDEEIEKCRELAFHAAKKSQQSCKGQQVTPSDDYEYQFAWAIEAAVLAKLNSAEPVAWMAPGKESLEFSRKDTVYGSHTIPLYLHPPAPSAPEGFTLAPNEPTEAMISAAMSRYKHPSDSAAINFMQMHRENFKQDYIAMMAAARSENAAISQKEEA